MTMLNQSTRTVFGVEINLLELEEKWKVNTPQFRSWFKKKFGGDFVGLIWVDLNQKSPTDPEFTNVDIRDLQNMGISVEDMQYSYRSNGFIIPNPESNEFLPLVDMNIEFDDGRTRALGAMEEGERWLPAAIIKKPDNTLTSKMSTGFCANIFPPRVAVKPKDLIKGGIKLVNVGELVRNKTDIEFWLVYRCNIYSKYPNNAGGWVTKIVNGIYDGSATTDYSVTRKLDDTQWKKWLKNSPDLIDSKGRVINPKDITLYKVPSKSNEARLVYKLLENAVRHKHTYVALYCTDDLDAKTMRNEFKGFIDAIDRSHSRMIAYANNSIHQQGLNLNEMDDTKHYTFFILPCITGEEIHEEYYKHYHVFTDIKDF